MMISRSKQLLLAALFCVGSAVLAALPACAQEAAKAAPSPEKLALARQYLQVAPVEEEIKKAVNDISQNIKPDQRVLFRTMADKHIDFARLTTAAEIAAADTFTEDELKAMIAFFSSPEGKSVREKMPAYQAMVQPVITEVLRNFVMKIQETGVLPQN